MRPLVFTTCGVSFMGLYVRTSHRVGSYVKANCTIHFHFICMTFDGPGSSQRILAVRNVSGMTQRWTARHENG
ncbi:hypothetical protein Hanom_Chr10g00875071 [Helianthus anomalus]